MEPQVVKRDGRRENVSFDKVQRRIHSLSKGLKVDTIRVAKKVIQDLSVRTTKMIKDPPSRAARGALDSSRIAPANEKSTAVFLG